MKAYRVILSDETLAGVERYLNYLEEQVAPTAGSRWWARAVDQILSLDRMPHRCSIAPENAWSDIELRVLIVGRGLFIFTIDEDSAAVRVLKFQHAAQEPKPI